MLKLLDKLKLFTHVINNIHLDNEVIHTQNIGIVNINNNIEIVIMNGPLKGYVLNDKSSSLELDTSIDIKDVALELSYNKIQTMIDLLESMKELELTNEQIMGLSILLPKN